MQKINELETWKTVVCDGVVFDAYEVSDLGRVRSWFFKGKKRSEPLIMSGDEVKNGYLRVALWKDKKRKKLYIQRLVVQAFIGPIPKGYEVNHIDEDKKNNNLSNLEIVTHRQNLNHGTRNARAGKSISKSNSQQLDLMEVEYPNREFTFTNSYEASKFFNYKHETQIGNYISQARKKSSNIINIKGKAYYYAQEQKGVKANV